MEDTATFAHPTQELPILRHDWYGFVDGGGTYTRVGIGDRASSDHVYLKKYPSGDFASLQDILLRAFDEAEGVPGRVVYALAGPIDKSDGTVRLTNRPHWPEFSLHDFEKLSGSRGILHNDVELAAAGAYGTDVALTSVVRKGRISMTERLMAVTWSTGINAALFEDGRAVGLEAGYGHAICAQTEDESSFIEYVAGRLEVPYASAEQLLSGAHGQAMAPDWLASLGIQPSEETAKLMDEAKKQHPVDFGPALTAGLGHDPYCQRIMRVLGGLFGTYLRQLMVEFYPHGGVHLVGGIDSSTTELLANPVHSPLVARLGDARLPYPEQVDGIQVVVNRDPEITFRGAKRLVEALATA